MFFPLTPFIIAHNLLCFVHSFWVCSLSFLCLKPKNTRFRKTCWHLYWPYYVSHILPHSQTLQGNPREDKLDPRRTKDHQLWRSYVYFSVSISWRLSTHFPIICVFTKICQIFQSFWLVTKAKKSLWNDANSKVRVLLLIYAGKGNPTFRP